jgi:hypothetical protein
MKAKRPRSRAANEPRRRAIKTDVDSEGQEVIAAEARRQSMAASSVTTKDERFWLRELDGAGWK